MSAKSSWAASKELSRRMARRKRRAAWYRRWAARATDHRARLQLSLVRATTRGTELVLQDASQRLPIRYVKVPSPSTRARRGVPCEALDFLLLATNFEVRV